MNTKLLLIISLACLGACNDIANTADNIEELEAISLSYDLIVRNTDKNFLVKDETTPTIEPETRASDSEIQGVIDGLELTYNKNRVISPKMIIMSGYVGVFKYQTCGGYPEFHYLQDSEDGGYSHSSGNVGETFVDKNKNINWRFCLVPGLEQGVLGLTATSYPGGVLTLHAYNNYSEHLGVTHVYRYHDDESNNANKIQNIGKLQLDANNNIGMCCFTANTLFNWRFKLGSQYLGFRYGVIADEGNIDGGLFIEIDDENRKNANWARIDYTVNNTTIENTMIPNGGNYAGIKAWGNTRYSLKIVN